MRQMRLSRSYYRDCLGPTFPWNTDQSRGKTTSFASSPIESLWKQPHLLKQACVKSCPAFILFPLMFAYVFDETLVNSSFCPFPHHYSACLKINIVVAESLTGCQPLPFKADCWTKQPSYCLPFSASHQSAHLPRRLRFSWAEYLPIYSDV